MVYNEKEKVDSKVDDVAEILSAKRIWKVLSFSNPCESSSLELVLIDEKVSYFYYYVSYIFIGIEYRCRYSSNSG
jgi:hypothetical protein